MLAGANRIVSGDDYKMIVRRGTRVIGPHLVAYLRRNPGAESVRFGFIVAKNVGNAVKRNRVRRRLKAASFSLLSSVRPGTDVVIRALPSASGVSWNELYSEVASALARFAGRPGTVQADPPASPVNR